MSEEKEQEFCMYKDHVRVSGGIFPKININCVLKSNDCLATIYIVPEVGWYNIMSHLWRIKGLSGWCFSILI